MMDRRVNHGGAENTENNMRDEKGEIAYESLAQNGSNGSFWLVHISNLQNKATGIVDNFAAPRGAKAQAWLRLASP